VLEQDFLVLGLLGDASLANLHAGREPLPRLRVAGRFAHMTQHLHCPLPVAILQKIWYHRIVAAYYKWYCVCIMATWEILPSGQDRFFDE